MFISLFLTLILLSTTSMAIDQSIVAQEFEVQEETTTTNIFTDYTFTEFGVIKIHNTRASWNDARNICLDENAQLAIIDSASQEAMILKHMRDNGMSAAWLGIHDLFGKKQWTTLSGERLYKRHYVHWNYGEPNGAGADEHCVELNMDGMNDLPCDSEKGFICEKSF